MRKMLEDFNKQMADKMRISSAYEESGSYEMAYMSLWSILETALKDISPYAKKIVLLTMINEWRVYLDKGGGKEPKSIKSFLRTRSEKIPPIDLIEALLGDCPIIKEILNSESKNGSTKWRDKRNNIAHNAEGFHQLKTYLEYKNKLLDGINEFVIKLSNIKKPA